MQTSWRQSVWSKSIAAGFIALICLGNYWFVHSLTGGDAPPWLQVVFGATVLWIFGGGIALALSQFLRSRSSGGEASSTSQLPGSQP